MSIAHRCPGCGSLFLEKQGHSCDRMTFKGQDQRAEKLGPLWRCIKCGCDRIDNTYGWRCTKGGLCNPPNAHPTPAPDDLVDRLRDYPAPEYIDGKPTATYGEQLAYEAAARITQDAERSKELEEALYERGFVQRKIDEQQS